VSDNWREVNGIWRGHAPEDPVPPASLVAEVDAALESMPTPVLEFLHCGWIAVWVVRRVADHYAYMGWEDGRTLRGWPEGEDLRYTDALYHRRGWISNGRRLSVALIAHELYDGKRWRVDPTRSVAYQVGHELGHAFSMEAHRRRGDPVPHWREEFRRTYLEERAAALNCKALRYFTWHWAAGLTEVYAEAFALLTVGALEWGEAEFRAAFPRCIDLVRRDLDALIEEAAVAA